MATRSISCTLSLILMTLGSAVSQGGDWPMWRYDAGRTAASPDPLPPQLQLQWTLQLEPREQTWDDPLNLDLMTYDRVFEPVVSEGQMLIGFNDRDKVVAVDTKTGATQWTFFTDAPVRLPPVCGQGLVYFCSDDGHLYCLEAKTGELRWKFQGGPSPQKVIGNRRVISAWPARGGPVLRDGHVYFAASIWPFMATFIYALDAQTGSVVWMNDGSGAQYLLQPHKAPSFAGVAPQGCLVATQDFLLIPGGRSVPAAYRRSNGEFVHFEINDGGKGNGGSFVVANDSEYFVHTRLRGVRAFDMATGKKTKFETNEPVLAQDCLYAAETIKGRALIRCYNEKKEVVWELEADGSGDLIQAGDRLYAAGAKEVLAVQLPKDGQPARVVWSHPVEPGIMRLLAADQRLFAVHLDGRILAFGAEPAQPAVIREPIVPLNPSLEAVALAEQLLHSGDTEGYALWYGAGDEELLDAVVSCSKFAELVIVDPDPARVDRLRRRYDAAGVYGAVSAHVGDPQDFRAPRYIAHRIFVGQKLTNRVSGDPSLLSAAYASLRPYGGLLQLLADPAAAPTVELAASQAALEGAVVSSFHGGAQVQRPGALPGAADWTHQYGDIANSVKSNDQRVRSPLGLLWFGGNSNLDVLPRHGHGPPQQVVGGRLFIQGHNSLSARDVYTGRVLWNRQFEDLGTFGIYFDETYKDTPLDTAYNQVHIPGANARGTNYVVTPDRIYLVAGTDCQVLDPATGQTLQTIALPQADPSSPDQWGFLGVYQDVLLGGVGFAQYQSRLGVPLGPKAKSAEDDEDKKDKDKEKDKEEEEKRTVIKGLDVSASLQLVGFNRYSGEVLWRVPAQHSFIHNGIVAGGGRVYCLDKNPPPVEDEYRRRGKPAPDTYRIVALDAHTGVKAWEVREKIFGSWLSYSEKHDLLLQAGAAASDRLATESKAGMAVYNGRDGSLKWRNDDLKYAGPCILHNDLIVTNTNSYTVSAGAFSLLDGSPKMVPHPLTGELQPWTMTRAYGCNNIIASEHLLTFRSGAAGYYDLNSLSGTGNLGGFKSGCTSNLVVADGVLNAPDYTRTCSCAYQNQTSLALVHMADIEVWTVNHAATRLTAGQKVEQLGVNFGAPGDRRADNGVLWVEYPNESGDELPLVIELEGTPQFYRHHSSKLATAELPWVHASGIEGAKSVAISLIAAAPKDDKDKDKDKDKDQKSQPAPPVSTAVSSTPYRVQLYFTELSAAQPGQRVFDVFLQDQLVLQDFDIVAEAKKLPATVIKQFDAVPVADRLTVRFQPKRGQPILSGIEIQSAAASGE